MGLVEPGVAFAHGIGQQVEFNKGLCLLCLQCIEQAHLTLDVRLDVNNLIGKPKRGQCFARFLEPLHGNVEVFAGIARGIGAGDISQPVNHLRAFVNNAVGDCFCFVRIKGQYP